MAKKQAPAGKLPDGRIKLPGGQIIDPNTAEGQAILFNAGQAANTPGWVDDTADGSGSGQALVDYVKTLPPDQFRTLTGYDVRAADGGAGALSTTSQQYRADVTSNSVKPADYYTASSGMDSAQNWYNSGFQTQQGLYDQNDEALRQLGGLNDQQYAANLGLWSGMQGQLDWQDQQNVIFNQQNQALIAEQQGYVNQANAFDWNNYNTVNAATQQANANNSQALGNYNQLYGQLAGPLQSQVSWQGDLTSQAAQAYADPAAIAAQNQALGQLQGVANGSLDQRSQAATAQASAQAIAAQNAAAGRLDAIANGSLNQESQAQYASADVEDINAQRGAAAALTGIANGSNDVRTTSLEGYQGLKSAMAGLYDYDWEGSQGARDLYNMTRGSKDFDTSELHALTRPEITAEEQFIYEQAAQEQARSERATRSATMNDLRQRGIRGSGMEVGQAALAGQQTSQNRLLSDLGALANATQRANQYQQMYTAASNANLDRQATALGQYNQLGLAAGQSNMDRRYDANKSMINLDAGIQTANMDRRTQAQALASQAYAELRRQGFSEDYARKTAADEMNRFNATMQYQGSVASFDARSRIREQEFTEDYSRGVAADNMANNNANRRLSGMEASGQLATQQRSQSFNEAYQRGAAADQTAQFNRVQSLDVAKFNTLYDQSERDKQWARGTDNFNANLGVSQTNLGNTMGAARFGQETNEMTFGRQSGVTGMKDQANFRQNQLAQGQTDRRVQVGGIGMGLNSGYYGNAAGLTQLGMANNGARAASYGDYASGMAGIQATNAQATTAQAEAARAAQAAKSKGLLGTPLLSGNGILGIPGIDVL